MTQAIGSPGSWSGRVRGARIVSRAGGNADPLAAPEVVPVAGVIRDREKAEAALRQAASPRAVDHWFSHGAIVALQSGAGDAASGLRQRARPRGTRIRLQHVIRMHSRVAGGGEVKARPPSRPKK